MDRRRAIAGLALAAAGFGCSPRSQAEDGTSTPPPAPKPLERRAIPSSGQAIPIVGLGTWQSYDVTPGSGDDWTEARAGLERFVAGGGTVVDSSPMYGAAEAAVGTLSSELAVNDDLFLATKVWTTGRPAGIAQMEASFTKLKRNRIDLMQVHNLLDVDIHLQTLADLKAQGRVRHVGVTHYAEGGYEAVERVLKSHKLDVLQINYSAAERESERRLLPLARDLGVAVIANRPFAGGDLFRRLRSQPLPDWAGEIGATSWAQVMLKFVLSHPAMTCAIPGTRNPRYVLDNLGAGSGLIPDEAMRERIAAVVAAA